MRILIPPTPVLMLFALLFLTASRAALAQSNQATGPHIRVSLVSEYQQLTPGTNWLGLYLQPDPDWHTYWQNPGDSGEAPSLNWTLPEGVGAGDIQWPIPQAIPVAHLVNYGYEGANLLMVPVTVTESYAAQHDAVQVSLDASWLVCKEDCIPGWATLQASYPLSSGNPQPSTDKSLFDATRMQLPDAQRLSATHEINAQHLVVSVDPPTASSWQLFPLDAGVIQHSGEQQRLQQDDSTTLVLPRSDYFTAHQQPLTFLLTDGSQGYYVQSAFNALPAASQTPLITLMLMAFVGGLLLNLMPCVLPVLSIKALSLSKTPAGRSEKWAYPAGVFVSFNLFAVLILAIQQGGNLVGWGFHMQHPWVIAALAFLFVFIALNLLDVITLNSGFSGAGQQLVERPGASSHFFTGVLAVVVASPCTAPFMAAALGVALVSEPSVSLAIFNALAGGFALPLALISTSHRLRAHIPKPGVWMHRFKQCLAFPMFATVVWLLWVYLNQTSSLQQMLLMCGLLLFAFAVWLFGQHPRPGVKALAGVLLLAALGVPFTSGKDNANGSVARHSINAFSPEKLQSLRAQRQVVLVNMTADWCITCKVNEQVAFQSPALQDMLARDNIHYLVGDWTNRNDTILAYLNQYERAGVPLYVVYAGEQSVQVLPQILTADIVINALNQALGETHVENRS